MIADDMDSDIEEPADKTAYFPMGEESGVPSEDEVGVSDKDEPPTDIPVEPPTIAALVEWYAWTMLNVLSRIATLPETPLCKVREFI